MRIMHVPKSIHRSTILLIAIVVQLTAFAQTSHGPTVSGLFRGNASVSPSGAAQYAIPIDVPDGIAGMTPSISLNYQSDGGVGLAGRGWTLNAGAQVIHRCNGNQELDGVVSAVNYTVSDRLCLNGRRLVKEAIANTTYGTYPSSYRTEITGFERIEAKGTNGQAPQGFELTRRDGTKYYFGKTDGNPDGRIEAAGSTSVVRSWALTRIEDLQSNYIEYAYFEDNATGEYYLESVSYSGHGTTQLPKYEIFLSYEGHSAADIHVQYRAGHVITSSQRLKKIEVKYNTAVVRTYHLDYKIASGQRSVLDKVTHCQNVKLPVTCFAPIVVTWDADKTGWATSGTPLGTENIGERHRTGDWDGDGLMDIFFVVTSSGSPIWNVSLGANQFNVNDILDPSPIIDASETSGSASKRYELFDYNGDGRTDIFAIEIAPGGSASAIVYESTGNPQSPFVERTPSDTNLGAITEISDFRLLDYDGDGLTDFLYSYADTTPEEIDPSTHLSVRRNTGAGFSTTPMVIFDEPVVAPFDHVGQQGSYVGGTFSRICCTLNLNDDGIPDLRILVNDRFMYDCGPFPEPSQCFFDAIRWNFYVSNGTGYELYASVPAADRFFDSAIDINGDGLDDLAYTNSVGQTLTQINTGIGFDVAFRAPNSAIIDPDNIRAVHSVDVNYDGRVDRVVEQIPSNQIGVFFSTGDALDGFAALPGFAATAESRLTFVDVNGDGVSDVLKGIANDSSPSANELPGVEESCADVGLPPGCDLTPFEVPPPSNLPIRLYLGNRTRSDIVTSVTDGYGNSDVFTYEHLATSASYMLNRLLATTPTTRPYWMSTPIVTALESSTGLGPGDTFTLHFKYDTLLYHTTRRNGLGFRMMSTTDSRSGFIREGIYSQDYPKMGRIVSDTLFQDDGTTVIRHTGNDWDETRPSSEDYYYILLGESTTTRREFDDMPGGSNGALINTVRSQYEYDPSGYGQLDKYTQTTAQSFNAQGAPIGDFYTTITDFAPLASTSNWCLNGVDEITVKRSQTIDSVASAEEVRTIDVTFDLPNCRVSKQNLFSKKGVAFQSEETLAYDIYGNLSGSTSIAKTTANFDNGLPFLPRRSRVVYNTTGLRPADVIACFNDGATDACNKWDADNPFSTMTWDYRLGRPTTVSDVHGSLTVMTYDGFGRALTVKTPTDVADPINGSNQIVTYAYEDCSASGVSCFLSDAVMRVLTTSTSGGSAHEEYTLLDSLGRVIGRYANDVGSTKKQEWIHDEFGRVVAESRPYVDGETAYFAYYNRDALGRVRTIEENVNDMTTPIVPGMMQGKTTYYDYEGLTTRVTNSNGQETQQVRDLIGRIVRSYDARRVADSDTTTTYIEYEYDVWDAPTKVINKTDGSLEADELAESTTVMTYDERGRLKTRDDPHLGFSEYKYDPADALVWEKDAKNQIRTYEYDSIGRLVKRIENSGTAIFVYDNDRNDDPMTRSFGSIISSSVNGHSIDYRYDGLGRLIGEDADVPDQLGFEPAGVFSYDYGYDTFGRLATIEYPHTNGTETRFKVEYGYTNNQVSSVTNANASTEVFYTLNKVNGWGAARQYTLGNGVITDRDYDGANGWLQTVKSGPNQDDTVQNLTITYDNIGNVMSRGEDLGGTTRLEEFTYDTKGLNRLATATLTNQNMVAVQTLAMTYGSNGNILIKSDYGDNYIYGEGTAGLHQVTKVKNGTGTVATYTYDPNGNMDSRNGFATTWSSFNKPLTIQADGVSSSFQYDANNRRYRQIEIVGGRSAETIYVGGLFERHVSALPDGSVDAIGYRHSILVNGEHVASKNFLEAIAQSDNDGIPNAIDNCTLVDNANQRDTNGDGYGNVCDPDLNDDLVTNVTDLGAMRSTFFASGLDDGTPISEPNGTTWNPDADLNGDGVVNFVDLGILKTFSVDFARPGPAGNGQLGWTIRYFHQDHLQSITKVSDSTGQIARRYSYDAFGLKRDGETWEALLHPEDEGSYWKGVTRGYTDHEHLIGVGLIHMNGRVYDPELGRMMSTDPFIPNPLDTQSFNRLSYVANRPMTLTDPSGYMPSGDVDINDIPSDSRRLPRYYYPNTWEAGNRGPVELPRWYTPATGFDAVNTSGGANVSDPGVINSVNNANSSAGGLVPVVLGGVSAGDRRGANGGRTVDSAVIPPNSSKFLRNSELADNIAIDIDGNVTIIATVSAEKGQERERDLFIQKVNGSRAVRSGCTLFKGCETEYTLTINLSATESGGDLHVVSRAGLAASSRSRSEFLRKKSNCDEACAVVGGRLIHINRRRMRNVKRTKFLHEFLHTVGFRHGQPGDRSKRDFMQSENEGSLQPSHIEEIQKYYGN